MILPKGTSFNGLTQEDIDLMMSHINSYSREKLNDKAPIEMFDYIYGQSLSENLGLFRVAPNDILLKPSLLTR
jgi:hypothetical protein